MRQSVFLPGGLIRLAIIVLIVAFAATMTYILKYGLIADLFGVIVPGWNS